MKAIICPRYGPPEILELQDIPRPEAKEGEVLVEVRAASVNALDWRVVRASPFLVRFVGGFLRPKMPRVGSDMAGRVEVVGAGVSEFRPGDEVFGLAYGAFGEYAIAKPDRLARKPASASFESAAALPIAGVTALQAIRDAAHLAPGQRVLVNGAGGGVGTFAVQIAKAFGAEVTAVTSAPNLEFVRSIGADHVLDYAQTDFTRDGRRYDLVLDLHPTRSASAYKRALTPGGICIVLGFGGVLRLLALVVRGRFARRGGQRVTFLVAKPSKAELEALKDLVESGKIVPAIDRRFALSQVPEALRYVATGKARGKVVITVP